MLQLRTAVPRLSLEASRSLLTVIALLKFEQDGFVKIFSCSFNTWPVLVIKLRGKVIVDEVSHVK